MKTHDYKKLIVWQKSLLLCKLVYTLVKHLPKEETYGLSDQIRRAVVSIPSNIAEGYGRTSIKELTHFLSISRGSAYEVETQILLALELGFIPTEKASDTLNLIEEIKKILTKLLLERPEAL